MFDDLIKIQESMKYVYDYIKKISIGKYPNLSNMLANYNKLVSMPLLDVSISVNETISKLYSNSELGALKDYRIELKKINENSIYSRVLESINTIIKDNPEILKIGNEQLLSQNQELSQISNEAIGNSSTNVIDRTEKGKLKAFLKKLLKEFPAAFFTIVIFFIGPLYTDYYQKSINPYIQQAEFTQLQNDNPNLELRMITKGTPLYKGKKMKAVLCFLEKYDVVEVIDKTNATCIKVRLLEDGSVGWVYKKYTKASK